jgi:class 3 adenylate cyclase
MMNFQFTLIVWCVMLALVPSVLVYVAFSTVLDEVLHSTGNVTDLSLETMGLGQGGLACLQAAATIEDMVDAAQEMMTLQWSMIDMAGLLNRNLTPGAHSAQDICGQAGTPTSLFNTQSMLANLKAVDWFENINIQFAYRDSVGRLKSQFCGWQKMNFDAMTGENKATYYYGDQFVKSNLGEAPGYRSVWYVNQTTAAPLAPLQLNSLVPPASLLAYRPTEPEHAGVLNAHDGEGAKVWMSPYSGGVLLDMSMWLPSPGSPDTGIIIIGQLSCAGISVTLRSILAVPEDRLAVLLRTNGNVFGASDGKFHQFSDQDFTERNPLTDPPPVADFEAWNISRSGDIYIAEAGRYLFNRFKSWDSIEPIQLELTLAGVRYWVVVKHIRRDVPVTVVLLKHVKTVMGGIESVREDSNSLVSNRRIVMIVIMAAVAVVALASSIASGILISGSLWKLASGMHQLAELEFDDMDVKIRSHRTDFSEIHRCNLAFTSMRRGLKAFSRFVPHDIVRTIVNGNTDTTDHMSNRNLTIMFTDIEGFTTLCERLPPEMIVQVCTQYFDVCVTVINRNSGTVDKFIGDAIMAMWNAPMEVPGHEALAVLAMLEMHEVVTKLHGVWGDEGLPLMKFRAGVHTGTCLVGNFGCSTRISYTVMGDAVNLASRLEGLNKKFGTYLLISEATYIECALQFHFRRLSRVTVPGKEEVTTVYEVIARADGPPQHAQLKLEELESFRVHTLESIDETKLNREVLYKWKPHSLCFLLGHVRNYEEIWETMTSGNWIAVEVMLSVSNCMEDLAMEILRSECVRRFLVEDWTPWDGVLRLREK